MNSRVSWNSNVLMAKKNDNTYDTHKETADKAEEIVKDKGTKK